MMARRDRRRSRSRSLWATVPLRHCNLMKTAPQGLTERTMRDIMRDELGTSKIVDRSTFQAGLDLLRVREKAHTRVASTG